jgi:hypothetical protein
MSGAILLKGHMADYFTNFSVVLPLTKAQQEYAMQITKQMEQHRFHDEPLPAGFPESLKGEAENWTFETASVDKGIWIHSQYGGQDAAGVFIQHLLQKFAFAGGVAFEWSHDCSKPLVDAFGGGAAFVTANEIETFTTQEWLAEITGQRKHLFSPDTHRCVKCGIHADDDLVENKPCIR